jgi:hypothetical protein
MFVRNLSPANRTIQGRRVRDRPMSPGQQMAPSPKYFAWIAFGIYLALSLLFFGRGLLGHFSDRYIGNGMDAALISGSLIGSTMH